MQPKYNMKLPCHIIHCTRAILRATEKRLATSQNSAYSVLEASRKHRKDVISFMREKEIPLQNINMTLQIKQPAGEISVSTLFNQNNFKESSKPVIEEIEFISEPMISEAMTKKFFEVPKTKFKYNNFYDFVSSTSTIKKSHEFVGSGGDGGSGYECKINSIFQRSKSVETKEKKIAIYFDFPAFSQEAMNESNQLPKTKIKENKVNMKSLKGINNKAFQTSIINWEIKEPED